MAYYDIDLKQWVRSRKHANQIARKKFGRNIYSTKSYGKRWNKKKRKWGK